MTSTAELTSPSSANTPSIQTLDNDYTLEHKYTRTDGRIYLSGVQALVRLPLMQRLRDQAAGPRTGNREKLANLLSDGRVVDDDLLNRRIVHVANRANDQIGLAIKLGRGLDFLEPRFHALP